MVAAIGLPIAATALISHTLWLAFVAAAVLLVGIFKWAFEPFEV
jgi:hypothetical protein